MAALRLILSGVLQGSGRPTERRCGQKSRILAWAVDGVSVGSLASWYRPQSRRDRKHTGPSRTSLVAFWKTGRTRRGPEHGVRASDLLASPLVSGHGRKVTRPLSGGAWSILASKRSGRVRVCSTTGLHWSTRKTRTKTKSDGLCRVRVGCRVLHTLLHNLP